MAAQQLPIKFQKLLDLSQLGVAKKSIGFATLSLESDKYICIRDDKTVVIIDVSNPNDVQRRPITADSAIMNPDSNILALKAGQQLQVFNLSEKKKLKSHQISEDVQFWKWINPNTIGIVTNASVFHWSLDGEEKPVKIFDRNTQLTGCQIINYRASHDGQWLVLVGIIQREGRVCGCLQLYSVERKVSQSIDGHAAAFAQFQVDGATKPSTVFGFANRTASLAKLYIIEVGKSDGPGFTKRAVDLYFPAEAGDDFPVAMQISEKYNIIYIITKFGYLHMMDLETGSLIYRNRISKETIFVNALHRSTGGIMGVDHLGQVLLVMVDENTIVSYISNNLNNYEIAIKLASHSNLPGADDLFFNQFNKLFQSQDYKGSAILAAQSPRGILRTDETIRKFQEAPSAPGQPSPLLIYFGTLIESSVLTSKETVALARPVLQQNRLDLLERWLSDKKLTCSEELGDLVKPASTKVATGIYFMAEAHLKVIGLLAESGETEKLITYVKRQSQQIQVPEVSAVLLEKNPGLMPDVMRELGGEFDVNIAADNLLQRGMIKEATSLLLDHLKDNKPSDAALQTKVLEINLINAPQVADAILGNELLTHYDRPRIARLCEQAGLFARALEHYTDLADIKRVMSNTHAIPPEVLVSFFSRLSVEDSLDCLKHLMRINIRQNLQLVVQVCTKYSDQLSPAKCIEMFEMFNMNEGLFRYLGSVLPNTEDPLVHNKYIMAATKSGQFNEVERVVRESAFYTPSEIRDFLKEAKLADQLPLIIVCDRFDFVDDLTQFLYKSNLSRYIEAYVQRINPINTPIVVGALIDVGCNEEYIKNLIMSVRNLCPVDPLVEQVEKRHKLKLILPWLEARLQEGNQEAPIHNAIAKIYIDTNKDPETYLTTNQYYESEIIGKYCEKRDPNLAFIAYKRGTCDDKLIAVTNANSLFKQQARYCTERQDPDLWAKVLDPENEHRRALIDQVVGTALPETNNPEDVSAAVKAFMIANLPHELIHLLEKLVLETKNNEFAEYPNLQNLLIITAIKVDQDKVMEYTNRLNEYDPNDISEVAIQHGLFEEALNVYQKFKMQTEAVDVLLKHLNDIDRAAEFAERIGLVEVFSQLAKAQLEAGLVKEAIASYLKADDPEFYDEVIWAANQGNHHEDLVKYLEMCIKKVKEPRLESELVYAYSKTGKHVELESFISRTGCCANILDTGERCFQEGLYEAAKILFSNISNYSRLASALVKLGDFTGAVESARNANSPRTWKEVNLACVEAEEFALAQKAGLNILIHPDDLDELLRVYETRGYFEELIKLMETGLTASGDKTHPGLYTELAGLYSKYKEEKLMDFIKHHQVNIPKVIHYCQNNHQWAELTYLFVQYEEPDNAALNMINHSPVTWEHGLFKDVLQKVANSEICYKSVQFYLEEHPLLVCDMLTVVSGTVDHSRVVSIARKLCHLPLIKPYLIAIQDNNITAVNEALNELYIEEEDFHSLRKSIDHFDAFENIKLAQLVETHELMEFRRIAALLFKRNQRWQHSVDLSKKDKLYQDAIQTVAESRKHDVSEELLRFFTDEGLGACFAACLYTCYDICRPDVALELAWRNKMTDFCMPFLVQTLREYSDKVDKLVDASKPKEDEDKDSFSTRQESFMPQSLQIGYYQQQQQQQPPVGMPPVGGMPGMPGSIPGQFPPSDQFQTPPDQFGEQFPPSSFQGGSFT